MERKNSNRKPAKRRGRLRLVLSVSLLIVSAIVSLILFTRKPSEETHAEAVEASAQYIMQKLSAKPVVEGLEPVLIYQYGDADVKSVGSLERIHSIHAGVGTMVKLAEGDYRVITDEHLFATARQQNYACPKYVVQVLREGMAPVTRNLVDAQPFFRDKPSLVDVAVCKVVPSRDYRGEEIHPFSSFLGGGGNKEYRVKFNLISGGKPGDLVLRSLVSGESAKILARDDIPGINSMYYYIIDYNSLPGESGTGFVDGSGRFFVLKSSVKDGLEGFNKVFLQQGLIDKERKGFSVVTGAFDIKKER